MGQAVTQALIDDFASAERAANGCCWALVSDGVMGGLSQGRLSHAPLGDRLAFRMTGEVSLANNGGFLQMAIDIRPDGAPFDARGFEGLAVTVRGNGESHGVHLRTTDVVRPWQSYRAPLPTTADWTCCRIPFPAFAPHRIDLPLDIARLRRIGLVALGRPGPVDLAVADLRFY